MNIMSWAGKEKMCMPNKTPFDGIQSEIYVPVTPPPVWAEVKKPLNQMKVAIATAAGVHCKKDPRFNLSGDFTFREVPDEAPVIALQYWCREPLKRSVFLL